jgi:hypothetical protein
LCRVKNGFKVICSWIRLCIRLGWQTARDSGVWREIRVCPN